MEKREIVYSEELKAKLKKQTAIPLKASFKYVPSFYRQLDLEGNYNVPKEFWPIFTLKGLDGVDKAKVEDEIVSDFAYDDKGKVVDVKIKAGSIKLAMVRIGLLGYKNLVDGDFKAIPDKKFGKNNPCSEEDLRILPSELINELYLAIEKESTLTEEELLGLE